MKNRRPIVIALVLFISFVSSGWLVQRDGRPARAAREKARLFEQVLQYVSEYYVDSVGVEELYDMAIDGMLEQLDDPYTSFLRREAYGELSLNTTGNYGGVGLRIDLRDGWITVVAPIPDSPSERAGLASGDQLVEIEGTSTKGWDTQHAADVLRGEPGTDAKVTVVRPGIADSLRFTLTRAQIHVSSVEGAMLLAPDVGYLNLTNVTENSARELRREVDSLRDQGATGLILDLRDNPGGILTQGVELADLFLDRQDTVLQTRGRAPGATETYVADAPQPWPDMPVVVLVSPYTASAAEIVSGALQDHDRALVLGTPTFGKGVAYLLIRLTDTEAVTVTSSRWFTPSGRSIQRGASDANGAMIVARRPPEATSQDSAEVFLTRGGRALKAGSGGIQPDVLLPRDTLTDSEQAFAEALGSQIPTYRNVLSRYALDLKGDGSVTDPGFDVSYAMLTEIYSRLREAGVDLSDEVFDGAKDLIADQFAPELTRYVFGRAAELRRRALEDNQTQRAVELLREAKSPADLIAMAEGGSTESN